MLKNNCQCDLCKIIWRLGERRAMKIETDDDRLTLIAAFRYALGRMTYMPSVIASQIESCWNDLTQADRGLFRREIKEAIDRGHAGHPCDVRRWKKILELPFKER